MTTFRQTAEERVKEKVSLYRHLKAATEWLEDNLERVKALLNSPALRDFVFEPFKGVFKTTGHTTEDKVKSAITKVAVVNAVLAGLPGKMGVGVFVSIAFEIWLAYTIAILVGIRVEKPGDVVKYFGVVTAVLGTILLAFKEILSFFFSLFSTLPVNPLIPAELFATNLIGILFFVGFREAEARGSFRVPKRALSQTLRTTYGLSTYQLGILKAALTPANLKLVGQRLVSFLKGEVTADMPTLRGDVFVPAALSWLLARQAERLDGTLGEIFLGSIRRAIPELADASLDEMADFVSQYSPEEMLGVTNLLKGEMFERMVEAYENADGDTWTAELHEGRNVPGSDIVFTDDATGEQLVVSLKATDNPYYVGEALENYPDIPVMTTNEVSGYFGDGDAVQASGITHEHLMKVTEESFEELFWNLPSYEAVIGGGLGLSAAVSLYPFAVAFLRKRISQEQLTKAAVRVFGESGRALAVRLAYSAVFGPVFAWYLLARAVSGATAFAADVPLKRRKLVQNGHSGREPTRVGRGTTATTVDL